MYSGPAEGQEVLSTSPVEQQNRPPMWPVIAGSAVVATAVLSLLLHVWFYRRSSAITKTNVGDNTSVRSSREDFAERVRIHVRKVGGLLVFLYKITRLVAIATLLALVMFTSFKRRWTQVNVVLIEVLTLASVLATANVTVSARTSRIISPYLSITTLAVFAVYAYRDIWPLMTYTLRPVDEAEGVVCWVKVALATWAGVVGPLLEPYPYIPLNRKGPAFSANPEQTASLLSFIFYTFLEPIIWRAYRLPHLAHDQLPPLADYDEASYLNEQHYQHVDPFSGAKKGSMVWAIIKVLRVPLAFQALCLTIMSAARLASPLGVNRLLSYLETHGEGAFVKPWVWVLWIALGPITTTIFKELYLFFSTRSLIRVEALLTSLIFDHALRLRMKADVSEPKPSDQPSPAASSDSTASKPDGGAPAARGAKGGNLVGRIMNMATSDLNNITGGRNVLMLAVGVPVEVVLSMWFLYSILGWSSLVGLAIMVVLLPVPKKVAGLMSSVQKEKMRAMDSRVQVVTEMMGVLRMIKLFGWERRAQKDIEEKREVELNFIKKRALYALVNHNITFFIPIIHMIVTFATFTLVMKRNLTASIVFSSITAFDMIRIQLKWVSMFLPPVISSYVSLGRLGEFLWNTELLDSFDDKSSQNGNTSTTQAHKEDIGFGHSEFTWSVHAGTEEPSQQSFTLRIEDEVVFKRGALNLVVGPTGSGKTSVLMALLGEMHDIPLGPDAWVNLPRHSGVAYAAQESWVMSDTIKENILFGSPYDEERYRKVINQCALVPDIRMFKSGDETQVGEKGITLSGGQKARVTLARAIYSSAETLLLDDVLAALDVHTSRWIVNKCFKGDLLKGRTVILVTHNIALTSSSAEFVLSIGANGRIKNQGSPSEVLGKDTELAQEIAHQSEVLELEESEDDLVEMAVTDPKEGKLVVAEEIALGNVGWNAYKLFLGNVGGLLSFWVPYVAANFLTQFCEILDVWWLGWWAQQYATSGHGRVNVPFYIGIYSVIITMGAVFHVCRTVIQLFGSLRAERTIHDNLMSSLLGSTFRWLDVTPTSRIITRCTQDIQAIDGPLPMAFGVVYGAGLLLVAKIVVVVVYTSVFLPPALLIVGFGIWLGRVYIKAQLSVKREMSNSRAPVLATFGSAIQGLISIRAYGAQQAFKEELLKRINDYTRAGRMFWCCNRWIATRLDALSAIFGAGVSFYFLYGGSNTSPSGVGFVLTMAVSFTDLVLGFVHWLNQLEVNANSLERVHQYIAIEQEPKGGMQPPAYWPSSGSLHVEGLSASYTQDGPKVLQDLSFEIKGGQRVGVVGRTGAGKSSLTLALLRCIPTEGLVVYDGVPTASITLDALRSNVTIIPQVPELMSGTLRHNLDPFGQHDDAILNDALRSAGLFSLQKASDENRIGLDTKIAGGGSNLSVGQRQIIALARAIVRQSKLLILDEATSAIDYQTDAVIQQSLRTELKSDVTVITVAHRLQTVMDYDMIMVLDAGRLVEFDTPKALLRKKDGLLYALVEQSADKEELYAVANRN